MVPGIALIADRQPLPILRKLCGAIILLVMARIALDPRIVGGDVGKTPIFNWLLWGYGVPARVVLVCRHACCAGAPTTCPRAWRIRRRSCSPR